MNNNNNAKMDERKKTKVMNSAAKREKFGK